MSHDTIEKTILREDALIRGQELVHKIRVLLEKRHPPPKQAKDAFDESEHPRNPEGTREGGRFTESGRSGVPTSDPLLAVQAKAGIAAVERLLPEAIDTMDMSEVKGEWGDLPESTKQKVAAYYAESQYDNVDVQSIDADMVVDVRWDLTENHAPELAEKTKVWVEGRIGEEPMDEYALDKSVSQGKPLDFKTLSVPDPKRVDDTGVPVLDTNALRHTDGTELTPFEKTHVSGWWSHEYKRVLDDEIERVQNTDKYLEERGARVTAEVQKQWDRMPPEQRADVIPEMIAGGEFSGVDNPYGTAGRHEPTHWVSGIKEGTHEDDDYARSSALAKQLTELRTDELRKERGLLGPRNIRPTYTIEPNSPLNEKFGKFVVKDTSDGFVVGGANTEELAREEGEKWATYWEKKYTVPITSEKLIGDVWGQWIASSSEGLSLSLQLAAARELGGHHRLTKEEVEDATADAEDYGGIATLQAYVRAQWEVNQLVLQRAGETTVPVYRGLQMPGAQINATTNLIVGMDGKPAPAPTNIKEFPDPHNKEPTVGFDFNGEHFVVRRDRADQDPAPTSVREITPYLERPYETVESAIRRRLAAYTNSSQAYLFDKLPDLQLQRGGAASTTGTRDVANEWGGVGSLPVNPTRVVLRIETPPTSVLSLPIYGANNTSEHEVVIVGTKDKWLWDAWRNRAPSFDDVPIVQPVKKAESQTLVIDLQAEDRGKPHWMSTVDWSKVSQG